MSLKAACPHCSAAVDYNGNVAGDVVECLECLCKFRLPVPMGVPVAPAPAGVSCAAVAPLTAQQRAGLTADQRAARYCPGCGAVMVNRGTSKGSGEVEVILWVVGIAVGFFTFCIAIIVPVVYSVWRHSDTVYPCATCGGQTTIPAWSDEARFRGVEIEKYTPVKK